MADEFRIIRLGQGYSLAIVQTPPGTLEDTAHPEGVRWYRWADWKIGEHDAFTWVEINENGVMGYFSGHADGLGYELPPETLYPSLDAVANFLMEKRERPKGEPMTLRLKVVLGEGPALTPEMRVLASRLLREAAMDIERGETIGSFNRGDDPREGAFAITDSDNMIPE